ncbi:MAG TPA: mechanosensitive ion channel family protein [Firmicutes bacterium]|nr:mechanosensitive ion channel family protein [Bacillota bacterium]
MLNSTAVSSAIANLPQMVRTCISVVVIIAVTRVAVRVASYIITKFFQREAAKGKHADAKRLATLMNILNSAVRYLIYFVGAMTVLERLGVPTSSIVATAGIGGLAIGFGAQNLVRDVITGFFILMENQYSVGDYVQIGNVSGIVEEMGIRVTKLRDLGGALHIIPNGLIEQVTNNMGPAMRVLFDILVSHDEDLDRVLGILEDLFQELREKGMPGLVEGPILLGVNDLTETGVRIGVLARAEPMKQWGLQREIRRAILKRFADEGISSPYPRQIVIFRQSPDLELSGVSNVEKSAAANAEG